MREGDRQSEGLRLRASPGVREDHGVLRDEVLAGRAGRGDPVALSLLLSRWQEPLLRFCRRLLRHEEDARDLAQDSLLRTTRALPSFDAARPFAPWIYRIARNNCLNHLEREKRRSTPAPVPEPVSRAAPPDVAIARREEVARVRGALAGLAPAERTLLSMKLVEGLSNTQIADRLGIGSGALRTRACRALAHLRRALSGEDGS